MKVAFTLNGRPAAWDGPPLTRLAAALRDDLGLTGTKVGCDAGDCGACTVRLDGHQVCSCLVAMGQVGGRAVDTVEGLANQGLSSLQRSFLLHGAAQCGICTPGMLMAAQDLLARKSRPSRSEVEDALEIALGTPMEEIDRLGGQLSQIIDAVKETLLRRISELTVAHRSNADSAVK